MMINGQTTIEELAAQLPKKGRLMGLDLGTKTIGLALSDVERRLASPLDTIRRVKFSTDADTLLKRLKEFDVLAIVIGLPLNMDGTDGPRVQATRAFARNLSKLSRADVYWDERLSTAAVARELIARCFSRPPRRGGRPDGRRLYFAGRARPPRAARRDSGLMGAKIQP